MFTSFQGPVPPLKTHPPKVLVSTLLIRTFRKSHVKDPQEVPFFKDRAAPRLHGILSMFMEKRIKWSSPSIAFLTTLEFCVQIHSGLSLAISLQVHSFHILYLAESQAWVDLA